MSMGRREFGAVAAAVGAMLLAVVILHPQVALQGKIYASSDAQAAAAFQRVAREAMAAGEAPLWNPFVFLGMPSFASLGATPDVYPLEPVLRGLRRALGLPPMTWLLFHLVVAGLGMTGWLRWRGASWAAAIAGGVLVTMLPKLSAWGAYGHGTKVGTFAWMPWALWACEALVVGGRLFWAAALAAALALQLLRAHVQIAYYTVLAIAVIAAVQLLPDLRRAATRGRAGRRVGWLILAGGVALGAALVLYLPVLEYQAWSVRGAATQGGGAGFDYATGWSLSWPELATLWWPTAAGYGRASYSGGMPFTDYPNYIGLPLLLLAGLGFATRRDRAAWALLILVILSTAVALGRHFFVYRLFFESLPAFKKFRVPVMILIVQEVAVIVLAMRGLDRLVDLVLARRLRAARTWVVVAGALSLVLLSLGSIGAEALRQSSMDHWTSMARGFGRSAPPAAAMAAAADLARGDALRLGAILLAALALLVTATRRSLPRAFVVGSLGALLALDLAMVDRPLLHPEHSLPQVARQGRRLVSVPSAPLVRDPSFVEGYTEETALARWLRARDPRPRVLPLGGYEGDNRLAAQHLVSLGGYHAAKLKTYEDLRAALYDPRRPRFDLAPHLGAQWLVSERSLGESAVASLASLGLQLESGPAYAGDDGEVWRISGSRPRARLVHAYELEAKGEDTTSELPTEEVLRRVLAPSHLRQESIVISAEPDPRPRPASDAASERVEKVHESFGEVVWKVRASAPGLLCVADPFYPQWRVEVNGTARPLLRAEHALRAVALEAGESEVRFYYAGTRYAAGRRWSRLCAGLILLGLVAEPIWWWRRRRRAAENGGIEGGAAWPDSPDEEA